jgi:signal transduction histidine kinase
VIKGFSSRISEKQGLGPGRYRSYAGVIEKSSGFLYSMAEEIIFLSKLEINEYPLPFEGICMEETVRQIISIFFQLAKEKEISIRFEKAGEVSKIRSNLAALKICLSNLIENAIKYSPQKTCVRVNLLCRKERRVVLNIKDRGPGIPEEEMESIFKKFYRGKNVKDNSKGTGLGLYITKTLVEKVGGTIRVFNRNRAGCCFEITYQTH